MAHEIPIKQIDRRTSARYLQRGQVDQKEYDRYIKALPDLEDKCVKVETEQPSSGGAPTR